MYKKVAQIYLTNKILDEMQELMLRSRAESGKLRDLLGKAIGIVEEAEWREAVYKDVGDVIPAVKRGTESLEEELTALAYLIDHLAASAKAEDLHPNKKRELNQILKSSHRHIQETQGYPWFVDTPTPAEMLDTDEGEKVSPPFPTDYSGASFYVTTPNMRDVTTR